MPLQNSDENHPESQHQSPNNRRADPVQCGVGILPTKDTVREVSGEGPQLEKQKEQSRYFSDGEYSMATTSPTRPLNGGPPCFQAGETAGLDEDLAAAQEHSADVTVLAYDRAL